MQYSLRLAVGRIRNSGTLTPLFASFLAWIFLVALPIFTQSAQLEQDRGSWRTAASMPTKRTEVAVAALEGKIYVVGGFEKPRLGNVLNFAITPAVEVYDPETDRWASKAPLPIGLHHVGIGVTGGRLAGYMSSAGTVSLVSVSGTQWRRSMPMIRPRTAGLSVLPYRQHAVPCQ